MKPACAVPIILLIALSGCSRETETHEAPVAPYQATEAAGDTDALPVEEPKPAKKDPAMRPPVEFD